MHVGFNSLVNYKTNYRTYSRPLIVDKKFTGGTEKANKNHKKR